VYYALEATGDLEKLEGALFRAINDGDATLVTQTLGVKQIVGLTQLIGWIGAHGGDAQRFKTAYQSAEVKAKLDQADAMYDRYRIDGSSLNGPPAIVVDGKYLVLGWSAEEHIKHIDELIAKVRAENQATATRSSR
jgi:thiol:disulfide interchange protein DsbA